MRAAGMRHLQVQVSEREPQSRREVRCTGSAPGPHTAGPLPSARHRSHLKARIRRIVQPRPTGPLIRSCRQLFSCKSCLRHTCTTPRNSRRSSRLNRCSGIQNSGGAETLRRFSKTSAQSLLSILYLSVARLLQVDVLEDGLVREALEVAVTLLLQVRARKVWRRIVLELLLA